MNEIFFTKARATMVHEQINLRGITDTKILDAFLAVPRHLFIPESKRHLSYSDNPVSIGEGQTISQPYIVALMVEALRLQGGETILEIGVGSGYQAAILKHLGAVVYGVERIPALLENAKATLSDLGYGVTLNVGDGTRGWQEHAPYDRIVVSAAAPMLSPCWLEQMRTPGKLIVPLGGPLQQELTLVEKDVTGVVSQTSICGCMFVPLVGRYGYKET